MKNCPSRAASNAKVGVDQAKTLPQAEETDRMAHKKSRW